MTMRKLPAYFRTVKALAVLATLCTAAPAGAAQCTANQINGRWALYYDDADGDWTECFISVRQNRNLSAICDVSEFGEISRVAFRGILRVTEHVL